MKKINGEEREESNHTSTESDKKKETKDFENDQIKFQKDSVSKANDDEDSNPYAQIGLDDYGEFNYNESTDGNYTTPILTH